MNSRLKTEKQEMFFFKFVFFIFVLSIYFHLFNILMSVKGNIYSLGESWDYRRVKYFSPSKKYLNFQIYESATCYKVSRIFTFRHQVYIQHTKPYFFFLLVPLPCQSPSWFFRSANTYIREFAIYEHKRKHKHNQRNMTSFE